MVLAIFRGDWCPYCQLTMAALEERVRQIEALGATGGRHHARTGRRSSPTRRARRGIGYLLLSDPPTPSPAPAGSPGSAGTSASTRSAAATSPAMRRFDVAAAGACRVRRRAHGARGFAFTDADPSRWPDPEELLASLRELPMRTLLNR